MKNKASPDAIDRRILDALQQDARITHAALAEKVGASTTSVWRRIKLMESLGVLGPTVRLVRPQAMGFTGTVLCLVSLKSHLQEHGQAFESFVADCGEVLQCDAVTGAWDYLLRVGVRDVPAYERFLMGALLSHPSVGTVTSHFALRKVKGRAAMPA